MPETDEILAARSQHGDRSAFSELVNRHQQRIYSFAYHYLGSVEDASDATQETFVRAFTSLSRFRTGQRFGPWLSGIAAHVCADLARRRRPTVSLDDVQQRAEVERLSLALDDSPQERAEQAEVQWRVRQAVQELPEAYRTVIILHYLDGQSCEEIARDLNLRTGTVRVRLHRGREQLREKLAPLVSEDEGA